MKCWHAVTPLQTGFSEHPQGTEMAGEYAKSRADAALLCERLCVCFAGRYAQHPALGVTDDARGLEHHLLHHRLQAPAQRRLARRFIATVARLHTICLVANLPDGRRLKGGPWAKR